MIDDVIMPHWYSPKEVWNLPQLDGSEAIVSQEVRGEL